MNGEEQNEGVMPLVLCRSRGGPYDDEAFVSGWRLGDLAAKLAQPGISTIADSIRPPSGCRPTSSPWRVAT